MPMNFRSSVKLVAAAKSLMTLTFSVSTSNPSLVMRCLRKLNLDIPVSLATVEADSDAITSLQELG